MGPQRPMLPLSFSVSLLFVLFFPTVFAQTSTLVSTSPPPSTSSSSISASVVPGSPAYSYFGCYSETTSDNSTGNSRALTGGPMKASDGMTVEQCLSFCGTTQYAGLEYGRECWCAPQLNTLSQKLPDTSCQLSCAGNQTELCGGSLTLMTYQRKPGAKSEATMMSFCGGLYFITLLVGLHVML